MGVAYTGWLRFGILLLGLIGLLPGSATAAGVNLIWDPSPDATAIGYVVYYGPVGSTSPSRSDVGNTTNAPVNSLQSGLTYFFYVTAYDSARNESDPSNVINYTVPTSTNVNTAPGLGTIANQTVPATSNLAFTATASDVDVPAQTLTFSLDAGAPTGASINPSTGRFSWTPTRSQTGTFSVTVRVTDNGSPALSATRTVSITVTAPPNSAPTLGTLANQGITATSNLTFTATAADVDVPAQTLAFSLDVGTPAGASINPSSGVFSWTPTRSQTGTFSVTVRVTDNGSPALSAIQTVSITVTAPPNSAPTLGALVNQSVTATSNLIVTVTATDVDVPAQTLTFSLDAGAPVGAAINPLTGVFSWTPTPAQLGSYSVTVRVTDDGSPALSASRTMSITVTASPNTAPTLGPLANQSVAATSNLTFAATATDLDVPAQTLTFSLDAGAPNGASISPTTGVFSWTPTRSQIGTFSVTVRVTDNGSPALSASRAVSVTVTAPPNTAPELQPVPTITASSNVTFTALATDADLPPQTLTFSLDAGAPAGASINPTTGVFFWAPTESQVGTYLLTIRVTDSGSPPLSTARTFSITVTVPPNRAPSLGTLANRSVIATSNLTFTATATDVDVPAQTLTFSLDAGTPAGASIDPSTGVFSWTPTAAQIGSYSVTVRVTDNGSPALSASQTILITVSAAPNTAPTLGIPGNQTVTATSNLTFTATASDADVPAQTLTFSLGAGAPSGASINPSTGLFSWTPARAQIGVFSVTVRVTDNGTPALSASRTVSITVMAPPNTAPVLGTLADQTTTVGIPLSFPVTATDVDLPAQTLTFSLDAGAPDGASINPNTGAFSWTPTQAQVGTNKVTIRVTDSGAPALSDEATLLIAVSAAPDTGISTNKLLVRALGQGTLSPNYSNTVLKVGQSYAMAASGANGFTFVNWVVSTNWGPGATVSVSRLSFTMQPYLTVQANFADTRHPSLGIASPIANQRISNDFWTVRGTVAENDRTATVLYQINNGDWTEAVTTNQWTNWTAGVRLVPGANTLRAYARDTVGGCSGTNSVLCTYVLTTPLQISALGQGYLSRNYSNTLMEVGHAYTVQASGINGHVFSCWLISTNWSDAVTSRLASLTFTMQSNLTLRPVFADVTKPTLTVTSLKAGQRFSNDTLVVRGTARDNACTSNVWFRLSPGAWRQTDGTTNWSAPLALAQRSNTFQVYVEDAAGNHSPTSSVPCLYVTTDTLTMEVAGSGTVTPNLNGQRLEIGQGYRLTAKPATGYLLSNWVSGAGQVLGTTPVLNFLMQPQLKVRLQFVPNPFLPLAGTFNGLFYPTNGVAGQASDESPFAPEGDRLASLLNTSNSGSLRLTLAGAGTFSGNLALGAANYAFSGAFDLALQDDLSIPRPGKTPLQLHLELDAEAHAIVGTVTSDAGQSYLWLPRGLTGTTNPYAGTYTLAIDDFTGLANSPVGSAAAAVTVSAAGNLQMTGTLPDGTSLSRSGQVSEDGFWPLFVPLNSGRGMVLGWVNVGTNLGASFACWVRPPLATDRYYPLGFATYGQVDLRRYKAPAAGQSAVDWTYGTVEFSQGNLPLPLASCVTVTNNLVRPWTGTISNLNLTITANNGLFSGTFLHPATRLTASFRGVILQATEGASGFGWFLGTNQFGALRFEATDQRP